MPAAFVQGIGTFATTSNPGHLAYNSSVTKGNLLVIAQEIHGSLNPGTVTVTDSVSTAYQTLQPFFNDGSGSFFQLSYGFAGATGANTVFCTIGNATGLSGFGLNMTEFSGVNVLDQYAISGTTYAGASPQVFASPTLTPNAAAGVAIAFSMGSGANPSSFVGTNSFTDNFGFWANNQFVDQNWKVFSTNASIQTNVTVTYPSGTLFSGRIGLATFILKSGNPNSLMLMGCGT